MARAAEATRPRTALEIYRQAKNLIAQQSRLHYQAAWRLLTRARDLCTTPGEEWAWTAYINGLRERNRRLRAFRDELHTAGL